MVVIKNELQPVVVGAGPLGLMSALMLARYFNKVVLVGKDAPTDGRTTAIMNEGRLLLEKLDVWANLSSKSAPLKVMRIVDGTKRLVRTPEVKFEAQELKLDAFGHNIKNSDLLDALNSAIQNQPNIHHIKAMVAECSFCATNCATLSLDDGTEISANFVVAADGRQSLLREGAGIESQKWAYPQTAIVVNVNHTRPHNFTSTEFHTETGPFTLVPLPGNRSSLVWVEKPENIGEILAQSATKIAHTTAEKSHYLLGDIELDCEPMTYPLSGLHAKSFGKGSVVLVGESAHVFPPIGAQGMNLGVRDIKALERIISGLSNSTILDVEKIVASYDKVRRIDVNMRTRAVDLLNRSLLTDFLPIHLARGLGLYAIDTFPLLRKFAMRQGLGVNSHT